MQKDLKKYRGYNSSDFWLCIDNAGECTGTLFTPCIDIPIPFCSLSDFLLKANDILDAIDFPQRFMTRRSLLDCNADTPPWISAHLQEPASDFEIAEKFSRRGQNTAMRFFVRVMCRQNASWQGELRYVSKNIKVHFRSALELIEVIYEATEDLRRWSPTPRLMEALALEG